MGGAKDDTLRSLLLDPYCEAILPLVARLFPGKTPAQLLESADTMCLNSLQLDAHCPRGKQCRDSSQKTGRKEPVLFNKRIEEIIDVLCLDELAGEPVSKKEGERGGEGGREEGGAETGGSTDELCTPKLHQSPYELSTLSYPPLNVSDILKGCHFTVGNEQMFHCLIYYTKKSVSLIFCMCLWVWFYCVHSVDKGRTGYSLTFANCVPTTTEVRNPE